MTARYIDVGLLGPIEVHDAAGTRLEIPRGRPLTLLALLLTCRDDIVPADAAIEALWPGRPPKDPRNALQLAVSRLRRALASIPGPGPRPPPDGDGSPTRPGQPGQDVVVGTAGGYLLRVPAGWVDADRFETLVQAGRAQFARHEAADAATTLRRALSLWRGPAYAEVRDEPFARAPIARLDQLRITALADRIDADLTLGRHAQLTGELQTLVGQHPLQERLRRQLMFALYGSGRQADALAVYRDARRTLIEELGVEPAGELRDAHRLVLGHGELPPVVGPVPPTPARPRESARRRLLTCLVAVPQQMSGPAGLADPEAVRSVLLELRSQVSQVCATYHGAVRDGEAADVTAVFGWPRSRENDALNAVLAASQIAADQPGGPGRSRQPVPLGVGVATGEVVTTPAGQAPFLLGDLAERAGALARTARPHQVLLAPATWRLVAHAARGSPAPAGTASGGGGLNAIVLSDIDADATSIRRSWEGPYVGRETDLGLLDTSFGEVRDRGAGHLVTVLGEPGVGKTRLSLEFERLVRPDAIVLRGRCRLFDEGIPYRPFQEIIERAAGGAPAQEWLARIGVDAEVRQIILAILGQGQERTGGQTRWAIGQLMAAITKRWPAVVIVDDLQHASPEVLDVLAGLAQPLHGLPVLVICLARPELLQDHPGWGSGWRRATTVPLRPLGEAESRMLLAHLTSGDPAGGPSAATKNEVIATAGGNPLFLEQLARHLLERPGSQEPLPPALQGLLASRLDLLPGDERTILERGAVEGDTFQLESVAAGLGPPRPAALTGARLERALDALIRRDLVVPDAGGGLGGGPAFGFRHRLIREAAYAMLTRAERARLHEQHADWLRQLTPPGLGGPARQASHLEQAHAHLIAIEDPGHRAGQLAARAGQLLTDAARQAHRSGELTAEIGFLERARHALGPRSPAAAELLPLLASALVEAGTFDRAAEVAALGAREGARLGRPAVQWRSMVERERARLYTQPETVEIEAELTVVRQATGLFAAEGDDLGLARAHYLHAELLWMGGQPDGALNQCERQVRHAKRISAGFEVAIGQTYIAWALVEGGTPVPAALRRLAGLVAEARGDRVARLGLLGFRAVLQSMAGTADDAGALMEQSRRGLADLDLNMTGAAMAIFGARMRLRSGDYRGAEAAIHDALGMGRRSGDRWVQSTALVDLALVVIAEGRRAGAAQAIAGIDTAPAPHDTEWVVRRLMALSGCAALAGDHEAAARHASEAVARVDGTQLLPLRSQAHQALACALHQAGRAGEAAAASQTALALATAKGDLALVTSLAGFPLPERARGTGT